MNWHVRALVEIGNVERALDKGDHDATWAAFARWRLAMIELLARDGMTYVEWVHDIDQVRTRIKAILFEIPPLTNPSP